MDTREVVRLQRKGAETCTSGLHGEAPDLGHRVARSVAGEGPEGVKDRLWVEASTPERLEEFLDEPDPVHRVRRADDQQREDVRMLVGEPPKSPVRLPDPSLPALVLRRYLQLAKQDLDHPVKQSILVRDVVVERHRLDPKLTPKLPHRESLQPLPIHEPYRRL